MNRLVGFPRASRNADAIIIMFALGNPDPEYLQNSRGITGTPAIARIATLSNPRRRQLQDILRRNKANEINQRRKRGN
jgi:hypothetical protein